MTLSTTEITNTVTVTENPDSITIVADNFTQTGGSGTVTSVSVATANGVSGSVATATTTPAITLTLGAITPTTVNGLTLTTSTGTVTITNLKTFAVTNTITLSGTDGSTLNIGAGGTLGSAAFVGATTGGAGLTDAGKAVLFNASGQINGGFIVNVSAVISGTISAASVSFSGGTGQSTFSGTFSDERDITIPDLNGTIALTSGGQTLTNKTISGASNTITNVSLTTGVTGTLPVSSGGTGATTPQGAINALSYASPSTFSGLRIWLDAVTLKYQGSAEMADGTAIDTWRSNCKLTFTSADPSFTATSTARPLYKTNAQNSLPGVLFDGSNDLMTGPTEWSNIFSRNEHTILIVCKPTALVSTGSGVVYGRPQLIGTIGQYDGISVSPSGSNNIFTSWSYDSVGARTASTGTLAANSMALIETWHENGQLNVALNQGSTITTSLRETTTSGGTMQLGTSGSSAFYTGYIFEIAMFDRALPTAHRTSIANWLRSKWNF